MKKLPPHPVRGFMNLSLAKKLLLLYLLIVLVPITCFFSFYFNSMVAELNRQYEEEKALMLSQASQSLENNFLQIEYCASTFQSNDSIRNYVENDDLSTSDGVYLYLTGIKSAFDLMRTSNKFIQNVCIYRRIPKEMNDPVNVRNYPDSPYLSKLEGEPSTSGLTLMLDLSGEATQCVLLRKLYSNLYYREIGVTEIVCGADYLFAPLRFVGEEEFLLLTLRGETYRVENTPDGIHLSLFAGSTSSCHNRADLRLEKIEADISYYYPDFHLHFSGTLLTGLLTAALVLIFFSLIYYLVYLSITKRITGLTNHIISISPERPQPYTQPLYRDEIGELMRRFNEMVKQIDSLINESYRKERLVNQAQYYAMESQITPHFLYNTLESINMLIELEEYEKASAMMTLFGKFLRYNVSWKQEEATLEREADHIRDYLEMYTYRMGERFGYTLEIEESCLPVSCPYCMLQPVVENCFKHGFKDISGEIRVQVRAYRERGWVIIEIEDNGAGISPEKREELNRKLLTEDHSEREASVGLFNVNSRIRLLYGNNSGLRVLPCETGCVIRIVIAQKR